MNRLLILTVLLLTLLVGTPGFSDSSEEYDDVETLKAEWSESAFARKYPYYCEEPTDDCFFHAEQNVSMSMLILTMMKRRRGLEATVECIRNVEGPKRGRAWMNWVKDNPHRSYITSNSRLSAKAARTHHLSAIWLAAMKENFSNCW